MDVLLPPNASAFERSLEQAMARHGDTRDVVIDRLWRPYDCPIAVLPFLAWGLGVRRWDPAWPEQTRREAVAGAIAVHRLRGTRAAIEAALDEIGAVYDITERPTGTDFTIAISIRNSTTLLGMTDTAAIRAYLDDVKRFSVHYALDLSHSFACSFIYVAAGVGAVQVGDFRLVVDVEPIMTAPANQGPVAAAGADQIAAAGARITLDGSGSTDPDGTIASYAWVQTAGDAVVLDDADTATPAFDAPSTSAEQTLIFRLTVTDDDAAMSSDEVSVVVAAFVAPMSVSYRFDSIEALRAFATFAEGSDAGRWEIIATGNTTSNSTGPGRNSGGPYAATDTSSAGGFSEIIDNSTVDLSVEMVWGVPTGRVLRLECAIMGIFEDDGEGLMVQGMATGGQWADIRLIRGWSYVAEAVEGDDLTDYDDTTIACTRDGGWATFDVAIPDAHEQVRLRLVATGGNIYQHDIALWSAELRNT